MIGNDAGSGGFGEPCLATMRWAIAKNG